MIVLTVGHSNRAFPAFLALLRAHGVTRVVDVRRVPRSRRVPWANDDALARDLPGAGVAYTHAPDLGGLRDPAPGDANAGLGRGGLRAYADHALTPAFEAAVQRLLRVAERERVTVMCAEADPARCHRRILADALVARGVTVRHVLDAARAVPHALHPRARVNAGRVTYPDPQARLPS